MAGSRSRERIKGRRESGHFALLPDDLLRHPAVTTLGHAHLRVLIALAAQCRSSNYGALCLSREQAKEYGVNSPDTLMKAVRELEHRGLIERTYPGSFIPPESARFALGWRDINNTSWTRQARASRRYLTWKTRV